MCPKPAKNDGDLYTLLVSWKILEINQHIREFLEDAFVFLNDLSGGTYELANCNLFANIECKEKAELDNKCNKCITM